MPVDQPTRGSRRDHVRSSEAPGFDRPSRDMVDPAGAVRGVARMRTEKGIARATMIDVAKLAGVSQATVSLVMNGAGGTRVAGATRKQVREAAEALGYRIWRRSPVGSGALRAVGFLVDDTITHPLVNYAIEGAREAAWENDCVLMVLPTRGDEAQRAAALDLLFGQRLLGVICRFGLHQQGRIAGAAPHRTYRADQLLRPGTSSRQH